jgi:hypothetical protein
LQGAVIIVSLLFFFFYHYCSFFFRLLAQQGVLQGASQHDMRLLFSFFFKDKYDSEACRHMPAGAARSLARCYYYCIIIVLFFIIIVLFFFACWRSKESCKVRA